MTWDPAQYAKFADHRLRPALDLLARIPTDAPASVVDLGCGTGNVTERLVERWPNARVIGVDTSAEMLAEARQRKRAIAWEQSDLGRWTASAPVDVLYSNAALHWLGDHAALFPRLLAQISPTGVLAVQMPRNFGAPSHAIARELASSSQWRAQLGDLVKPAPVAEPGFYYDLLSGRVARLEIWETEYIQPLPGDRPVLEWIKGTWLRPFLDRLSSDDGARFETQYAERAAAAYPRRGDGLTILPFRRLFIVAAR
jgi:trans-aconitate 2-methyltransferase